MKNNIKTKRDAERKRLTAECPHLPDYQLCGKCYDKKWANFGSTPQTTKECEELIDAIFGEERRLR